MGQPMLMWVLETASKFLVNCLSLWSSVLSTRELFEYIFCFMNFTTPDESPISPLKLYKGLNHVLSCFKVTSKLALVPKLALIPTCQTASFSGYVFWEKCITWSGKRWSVLWAMFLVGKGHLQQAWFLMIQIKEAVKTCHSVLLSCVTVLLCVESQFDM